MTRVVAATAGMVGLAVLTGWLCELTFLTRLGPGWLAVMPNTALAFLLAASALWPLGAAKGLAILQRRWLVCAAAGGVIIIGLLTLAQSAFGVNLGVDEFLLLTARQTPTLHPGRMSQLAAVDFILLGLALSLIAGRPRVAQVWTAQLCSLTAAFGALIAVTGYLFGQQGLHQVPFFTNTALVTAITLLALGMAVCCAVPGAGVMALFNAESEGGNVLRRLLLPIPVLSLAIDWLELEGERSGLFPAGFSWMLDATVTTFLVGLLVWFVARLVHAKDLTREHSEATLRTSEERFRATFEQAAMGMTVTSADGAFLRANTRFCAITGYSPDEILHRTFRDITHPDDQESDQRQVQRLLSGAIPTYTLEKRYMRKDRSSVWVALTASLVRRDDGSPDYFIALVEDITQRRNLETQLRQTQKMEAVGRLAGGVAHDFNNMLTAIQGHASLIGEEAALPVPARESLQEIVKASQRAANLTRQLLLFGRREVMQPRRLNLNDTVTQMMKMLQRLIGENVRMTLHLHPQSLPIHADSGMIDQILMNLAVNARDAIPGAGSLIIVTSAREVDEALAMISDVEAGRYACLSVSDTGAGIAPEVLPRIFEPFFTTKDVGKGTGLGLATVFGIVKQHRGFVKVYSEPGHGTTFHVYLPLTEQATEELPGTTPSSLPRGSGETVLLVEDDSAVRKMATTMLTRQGYTVLAATCGSDALQHWSRAGEHVDLLLTDLIMPGGMTGIELASQLRDRQPGLRVIFTSGYSEEIAGRALNLQSGQALLQKPFESLPLLGVIHKLLHEANGS